MDSLEVLRRVLGPLLAMCRPTRSFAYFFQLPAEIRNMVYRLLFSAKALKYDNTLWQDKQNGLDRYAKDIKNLIVSKRWYREALPILLHTCTVRATDAVVEYSVARSRKAAVPAGIQNVINVLPVVRFATMNVGDTTIGNMELLLDCMPALNTFELHYCPPDGRRGLAIRMVPVYSGPGSSSLPDTGGIQFIRAHADDLVVQKQGNFQSNRLAANVKAWIRRGKPFNFCVMCDITCWFPQFAGRQSQRPATWKTRTHLNSKMMEFLDSEGYIKMQIPLHNLPV